MRWCSNSCDNALSGMCTIESLWPYFTANYCHCSAAVQLKVGHQRGISMLCTALQVAK